MNKVPPSLFARSLTTTSPRTPCTSVRRRNKHERQRRSTTRRRAIRKRPDADPGIGEVPVSSLCVHRVQRPAARFPSGATIPEFLPGSGSRRLQLVACSHCGCRRRCLHRYSVTYWRAAISPFPPLSRPGRRVKAKWSHVIVGNCLLLSLLCFSSSPLAGSALDLLAPCGLCQCSLAVHMAETVRRWFPPPLPSPLVLTSRVDALSRGPSSWIPGYVLLSI